ncbi:MAG: 4Fe-4S binding protein, partial [Planctomycetota bacterium]
MKWLLLISMLTLGQADAPAPPPPSSVTVPTVEEATGDVVCPYCQMINCAMPGHGGETGASTDQPGVMTHPGIPLWMAMSGVIAIIVVSHWVVSRTPVNPSSNGQLPAYRRIDLLKPAWAKALVSWSFFPMLMQFVSIALFGLIIYAGLYGSQRTFPVSNIAPVLTWNIWWSLLIFFILIGGSLFCVICPWEGLSSLVTALSPRSRVKKLGYERRWPKWAANIYPAMFLFILLTWFELGMDITKSPLKTAYMAIAFVGLAVLCAILYEKRAFCRHLCLVGRIQGLYALFSPLELRPRSIDPCRTCEGKECYHGSETATGCHLSLYPAALDENTYCTLCTECIRACPSDNLT